MTIYSADTTVTIDGTDYSGQTLRQITINGGRPNIQQQPQAGYANVQMVTGWNSPITVPGNGVLVVSIYDPVAAAQTPIFTGRISDVSISTAAAGVVDGVAIYTITAVGPLAELSRQNAGGVTSNLEWEPSAAIQYWLGQSYGSTWEQVGDNYTWATYPAGVTWADLLNLDVQGDFEPTGWRITHYAADQNSLALIQRVAESALGVFYETGDGKLNFYGSEFRTTQTPTEIPLNAISSDLDTKLQLGEVINSCVTQTWGDITGATWVNQDSITNYGLMELERDTVLFWDYTRPGDTYNQLDKQAEIVINARATPYTYPDTLRVQLENPNITDALRQDLLGVFCGSSFYCTGLPKVFWPYNLVNWPYNIFYFYVEGYTWNLTDVTADLTLRVTPHEINYEE